jgi:membrane protease YdiL (CAAX protease family)
VGTRSDWYRLIGGLTVVFVLFQWIATALGSDYGQAGLLIALVVVTATVGMERLWTGASPAQALRLLGLGLPRWRGSVAALIVSLLLVLVFPGYAEIAGTSFGLYPGWTALLPGLFAQAGIAEETLFRGYLFRHVRTGRPFWTAALLASGPFVLVHLLLFLTLPWPVAAASVLLASIMTFPLAHLFELGGNTIWAPALLHFVVQAAVKLVVPISTDQHFPLVWMTASAVVPFLVFLVGNRDR